MPKKLDKKLENLINICQSCGKEYPVQCKSRKSRSKFCSKQCQNEHRKTLIGEKAYHWKGGKFITSPNSKIKFDGSRYEQILVYIPEEQKYRGEHVLKAEDALGRRLYKNEHVHHINGNPIDNRNNNLLICKK